MGLLGVKTAPQTRMGLPTLALACLSGPVPQHGVEAVLTERMDHCGQTAKASGSWQGCCPGAAGAFLGSSRAGEELVKGGVGQEWAATEHARVAVVTSMLAGVQPCVWAFLGSGLGPLRRDAAVILVTC